MSEAFLAPLEDAFGHFDPNQPRDPLGKWVKMGSGRSSNVYVLKQAGRDLTTHESFGAAYDPQDREWASIRFAPGTEPGLQSGENLDWHPTLRDAKKAVERRVPRPVREAFGHFDPSQARDYLGRWKRIKFLGGTTGAELVEDKAGRRHVLKGGSSPEHVRAEYAANQLYETLGVPVPKTRMEDGRQVSGYVEGETLQALRRSTYEPDRARLQNARVELARGLAADALLANWDSIGLEYDNVIVPEKGAPVRIDNGGSLAFRAQGAPKGLAFGPQVTELGTLRDPGKNAAAAYVFGGLTDADVARQIDGIDGAALERRVTQLVKTGDLSAADALTLKGRLVSLRKWAKDQAALLREGAPAAGSLPVVEAAFLPALSEAASGPLAGWLTKVKALKPGDRADLPGGGWVHRLSNEGAGYQYADSSGRTIITKNVDHAARESFDRAAGAVHPQSPGGPEPMRGPDADQSKTALKKREQERAAAEPTEGGKAKGKPGRKVTVSVTEAFLPDVEEAYGAKQKRILAGAGRPRKNTFDDKGVKNPPPYKPPKKAAADPARGTGDKGGQFIRKGTSGQEVHAIQQAVGTETSKTGGASTDKPGSFGYSTAASVRAFQKKHGLQVDGVVGRQTAAAILGSGGKKLAPGQITAHQVHGLRRLAKRAKPIRAKRSSGGLRIL